MGPVGKEWALLLEAPRALDFLRWGSANSRSIFQLLSRPRVGHNSEQWASALPSADDGEVLTCLAATLIGTCGVEGGAHSLVAEGSAWDNESLSTWRCCLLVLEELLPRNWQIELLDPGSASEASGPMQERWCNTKTARRWNQETEEWAGHDGATA